MFDIKNPNSFLGGQNVHNLIIIGLLIFIIYKMMSNDSESSYQKPNPNCSTCGHTKAYAEYKKNKGIK
jgi:hypothetical protein